MLASLCSRGGDAANPVQGFHGGQDNGMNSLLCDQDYMTQRLFQVFAAH
jgi:hypothetical protein